MYTTKVTCGLPELHGKAKKVRLSRLSNQSAERRFMADNRPDTAAMNRAGNKKERSDEYLEQMFFLSLSVTGSG
jgi:hypothetical protein